MKNIVLYISLLLATPLFAQKSVAPDLPTKCIAVPAFIDYKTADNSWQSRYDSYQDYAISMIKRGYYQTAENNPKAWVAFSDRANNKTYDKPHGTACASLDFMQKVYIADIRDGWALVFIDKNKIGADLYINKSAVSKGWISIDNLLLWTKCPQTAQKILEKGLIIQDLAKIKGSDATDNSIQYLNAPSQRAKGYGDARQLEIPFIMKKENHNGEMFYLLSYNSEISTEGNIQSTMVPGWLSEKFVTPWNQRLCLEPAAENVSDLKNAGIYPAIFENIDDANHYVSSPKQSAKLAIKDYKKVVDAGQRPKGTILRSPILAKADRYVYQAVGIGTNEESNHTTIDHDSLSGRLNNLVYQLNNVNLIFVLDATNSMKPYFSEVAKALSTIIKRDYGQIIRMGVVVYRNEADGTNEIEYRKLTGNINEIENFIANTECYSQGKGYFESFYKGMETALDSRKMGYTSNQSNFIVAVGDCGNKENAAALKRIGEKLNANNIHFFAYNVAIGNNEAHWRYTTQVVTMLRNSIDTKSSCIDIVGSDLYRIFAKNNGACTRNPSTVHFGGSRLASSGNLNIRTFNQSIVETVSHFMDYTNNQIVIVQNLLNGNTKVDGGWDWDNMAIILRRRGFSEAEIEAIRKNGAPSKYTGFMPFHVNGYTESLFNYTLFFSHDELADLTQTLKRINPTKNQASIEDNSINRKNYQDALINLGLSFLGENEDNIKNMDFEELLQKIYGVPVKINNCGIPSIKDLTNPQIVSGTEFRNFANNFSRQTRKLENIISSGYRESFPNNGKLFYWIPFKDMPGYCAE